MPPRNDVWTDPIFRQAVQQSAAMYALSEQVEAINKTIGLLQEKPFAALMEAYEQTENPYNVPTVENLQVALTNLEGDLIAMSARFRAVMATIAYREAQQADQADQANQEKP